jgi:hypothetical protein
MNKIPAREVQVFVAGALALWGFRALIWLPTYLFTATHDTWWISRIIGTLTTGLTLPLGVTILLGKTRAIRWAQIFLWWSLVLISISAMCLQVAHLGPKGLNYIKIAAPDLLVCIVLLWLLCSQRFQDQSNPQPHN